MLRNRIAGSYGKFMFNFFKKLPNCFPKRLYVPLDIPASNA